MSIKAVYLTDQMTLKRNSVYLNPPEPTFCRVPINPILGFILRDYKKSGVLLVKVVL